MDESTVSKTSIEQIKTEIVSTNGHDVQKESLTKSTPTQIKSENKTPEKTVNCYW